MGTKKNSLRLDIFITFFCMLIAYWIHITTFLNWDVAWHVEGAKRLLAGGSYLVNTFDNNSLFVFAYFFPVAWLQKLIPASYADVVVIYILITALLPLILCYRLINKTFGSEKVFIRNLLYYVIVFIILFLPAFNLGHREIVLIYFYLPYFLYIIFSTAYPIMFERNNTEPYILALLATFGISQNIFYLCIPFLLDLYRLFKLRRFAFFQAFFYIVICLNILLVSLLYPEYIKHIVPMVLCYESGFNFPLFVLVFEILTFMSLLTLALVALNYRILHTSDEIIMCLIAAVCSLLIYFFELKLWYYHLYPALCFIMLILTFLVAKYYESTFLGQESRPHINLFSAAVASGILAMIVVVIFAFTKDEWQIFQDPQSESNRWISYAHKHFQDKKLFFFVIKLGPAYALPFYANANVKIVSPWSNPWMLPYIILQKQPTFCNLQEDIKIFQRVASQAIEKNSPDYIVIEQTPKSLLYQGNKFGYIEFFSQDKQFEKLFRNYVPAGQFDKFTIYKKK